MIYRTVIYLAGVRGRNAGVLNPWPRLNLDHVETLSLPLIEGALHWWEGNTFENVILEQ